MIVPFPSALIRYERLKRNWSQEGLCDGICAVSYLSKIEQGKAEPNPQLLQAGSWAGRESSLSEKRAGEETEHLLEG